MYFLLPSEGETNASLKLIKWYGVIFIARKLNICSVYCSVLNNILLFSLPWPDSRPWQAENPIVWFPYTRSNFKRARETKRGDAARLQTRQPRAAVPASPRPVRATRGVLVLSLVLRGRFAKRSQGQRWKEHTAPGSANSIRASGTSSLSVLETGPRGRWDRL